MASVTAQCDAKRKEFKEESKLVANEVKAMSEAIKILGKASALKGGAKKFFAEMSRSVAGASSFLQLGAGVSSGAKASDHLRAVLAALQQISPKLARVAQRDYLLYQSSSAGSADPFASVKKLIQGMIERLSNEAAEASTQNEWCTKENKKSAQQKAQKGKEIKKLTSRMNEMQASLAEYDAELKQMKKVMTDMEGNIVRAEQLRKKEKAQNVANVKEYKEAQGLIENAISVLQAVFKARSARQNNAGGASVAAAAAAKQKMLMLHGDADGAELLDGDDADADAVDADAMADAAAAQDAPTAAVSKPSPASGNADGTLTEAEMLKAVDAEDAEGQEVDDEVNSALTEATSDASDASAADSQQSVEDANAAWFHSDSDDADDMGSVAIPSMDDTDTAVPDVGSDEMDMRMGLAGGFVQLASSSTKTEGQNQNLGVSVLSLLDLAKSDFSKLESEAQSAEDTSEQEFTELSKEFKLKKVVFGKNEGFKSSEVTKLKGLIVRTKADLSSLNKERDAVIKYIGELQGSCQIKGLTHEEKVAQREKLIKSLRSALKLLLGK